MAQAIATHQTDLPPSKGVTLLELYEAADQNPVEVVNGEIVWLHPAERLQSRIAHQLFIQLDRYSKAYNAGEVWLYAPYVLDGDKARDWVYRARQPDVSFISRERVEAHNAEHGPGEGPWWLAPDLAIELVSPTDRYSEIEKKVAEYLRYGVRLVVLLNPEHRTARVYTPDNPNGILLDEQATLSGDPILPGWEITIKELFGRS